MATRFVDDSKLKRIDLGDGDWVEVPEKISYGTLSQIGNLDKTTNIEKTTELLCTLIKGWNLKDEKDNEVPISKENILKLDVDTVTLIANEIGEMVDTDKKKSIG